MSKSQKLRLLKNEVEKAGLWEIKEHQVSVFNPERSGDAKNEEREGEESEN